MYPANFSPHAKVAKRGIDISVSNKIDIFVQLLIESNVPDLS